MQVRLGERLEGPQAGAYYRQPVALVQALGRPSALDLSVEKSTEAGASLILMVQTAGSPRSAGKDSKARHERWARIAREAAKQSKQPAVPPVEMVTAAGKVLVGPWSAFWFGAFTAPATRVVSCAALRPFRGSSTMRWESTTWRRVAVVTSTCGGVASTS